MFTEAYLRYPNLKNNTFVFVSDDDLWKATIDEKSFKVLTKKSKKDSKTKPPKLDIHAIRLTNTKGQITQPKISPDMKKVAYISNELGEGNVYVVDISGGISKRICQYRDSFLIGWSDNSSILISTSSYFFDNKLLTVAVESNEILDEKNYGVCNYFHENNHGKVVARHLNDPAFWKGYKGGDIGQIWSKPTKSKKFSRLFADQRSNVGCVQVLKDKIYFISDKDSTGNIYSCGFDGKNLKKITNCKDYYVRQFSLDNNKLLYMSHGKFYLIDNLYKTPTSYDLNISVPGSFNQIQTRDIDTKKNINDYNFSYNGSLVAFVLRGNLFIAKPWIGSCKKMLSQSMLDDSILGLLQKTKAKKTPKKSDSDDKKNQNQDKLKNKPKLSKVKESQTKLAKSKSQSQSKQDQKSKKPQKYTYDFHPPAKNTYANLLKTLKSFKPPLKQGRFRFIKSFGKEKSFISVIANFSGEDRLVWHEHNLPDNQFTHSLILNKNYGKIFDFKGSLDKKFIVFSTFRQELWIYFFARSAAKLIASSDETIKGFDLSKDNQWVVYSCQKHGVNEIYVYNIKSQKSRLLLKSYGHDEQPVFDPKESYLYFLSTRNFNHLHSDGPETHAFYGNIEPFVVTLDKKTPSFFDKFKKFSDDKDDQKPQSDQSDKDTKEQADDKTSKLDKTATKDDQKKDLDKIKQKEKDCHKWDIDFDGIDGRIEKLEFSNGGWKRIFANQDYIMLIRAPLNNYSDNALFTSKSYEDKLYTFNKNTGAKNLWDHFDQIRLSANGKYLFVNREASYSLVTIDDKPFGAEDKQKPKYIDISRMRLSIDPKKEWQQMLIEAWHLQKENYYNPLHHPNFDEIFKKYYKILSSVNTRTEFSDLIKDLQGTLETSHCYEHHYLGDNPNKGSYKPYAKLGADVFYDKKLKCYEVKKIYQGENWNKHSRSPLLASGVSMSVGDQIYQIDGIPCEDIALNKFLENKAATELELTIKRKSDSKKQETVYITTLSNDFYLCYHNWVQEKRQLVKTISNDSVGYLHIPDMSTFGLVEFYKHFAMERRYESLIIDARYNAGGYVSEKIISFLIQKSIAQQKGKWSGYIDYPENSAPKNLICLVNGQCGSDGDIFARIFKEHKLGKLIGTRTWGGIIGINPRIHLADGTLTTQPEYYFCFKNEKSSIENNGVVPDLKIDISPDDYENNHDPQIKKAVELLLMGQIAKK